MKAPCLVASIVLVTAMTGCATTYPVKVAWVHREDVPVRATSVAAARRRAPLRQGDGDGGLAAVRWGRCEATNHVWAVRV